MLDKIREFMQRPSCQRLLPVPPNVHLLDKLSTNLVIQNTRAGKHQADEHAPRAKRISRSAPRQLLNRCCLSVFDPL